MCLLLKIYQFYVFVLFFAAAVVFYITYKLLINYSLHTILCAKNTVIYVRKFSYVVAVSYSDNFIVKTQGSFLSHLL